MALVTTVVWVPSLAEEILHATGMAKKKNVGIGGEEEGAELSDDGTRVSGVW